jgi:hypothetical protein
VQPQTPCITQCGLISGGTPSVWTVKADDRNSQPGNLAMSKANDSCTPHHEILVLSMMGLGRAPPFVGKAVVRYGPQGKRCTNTYLLIPRSRERPAWVGAYNTYPGYHRMYSLGLEKDGDFWQPEMQYRSVGAAAISVWGNDELLESGKWLRSNNGYIFCMVRQVSSARPLTSCARAIYFLIIRQYKASAL